MSGDHAIEISKTSLLHAQSALAQEKDLESRVSKGSTKNSDGGMARRSNVQY